MGTASLAGCVSWRDVVGDRATPIPTPPPGIPPREAFGGWPMVGRTPARAAATPDASLPPPAALDELWRTTLPRVPKTPPVPAADVAFVGTYYPNRLHALDVASGEVY